MDYSPPGSFVHGIDSPGKNTRVDCHFFLQGIFQTQRANPCFLHWQAGSLPLSHLGRPCGMLEEPNHQGWSERHEVVPGPQQEPRPSHQEPQTAHSAGGITKAVWLGLPTVEWRPKGMILSETKIPPALSSPSVPWQPRMERIASTTLALSQEVQSHTWSYKREGSKVCLKGLHKSCRWSPSWIGKLCRDVYLAARRSCFLAPRLLFTVQIKDNTPREGAVPMKMGLFPSPIKC